MVDSNGSINAGPLVNHLSHPSTALLVTVPPDNELIGRGDSIARHVDSDHRVDVLIVEEGATSPLTQRDQTPSAEKWAYIREASRNSSGILGTAEVKTLALVENRLGSPDRLDRIPQIGQRISGLHAKLVCVHHVGVVNISHGRLHKAVFGLCWPTTNHSLRPLLNLQAPRRSEYQPPGTAPTFQTNWFVGLPSHWKSSKPITPCL
jgi:LmbE family N-acetylglucosaminyl deacetylase